VSSWQLAEKAANHDDGLALHHNGLALTANRLLPTFPASLYSLVSARMHHNLLSPSFSGLAVRMNFARRRRRMI
jgi:hypothetical protein